MYKFSQIIAFAHSGGICMMNWRKILQINRSGANKKPTGLLPRWVVYAFVVRAFTIQRPAQQQLL